jgi:hypothetical protein
MKITLLATEMYMEQEERQASTPYTKQILLWRREDFKYGGK